MKIEVTMTVEVPDPDALYEHAGSQYCLERSGDPAAFDEVVATMGSQDDPDVASCVAQVVKTAMQAGGSVIVDSVTATGAPKLRPVPMVAASISNLTSAERDRITDAFGMEPSGKTFRCLEDIVHDGLRMSPKDMGFYVRLPALPEAWAEKLPMLTPEMRAIVLLAKEQGADRIEFDVDEDAADGLEEYPD